MPPFESMSVGAIAPTRPSRKKRIALIIGGVPLVLMAVFLFISSRTPVGPGPVPSNISTDGPIQYLAFQLFTNIDSRMQKDNYPPLQTKIKSPVENIVKAIGGTGEGNRKLGFFVGPIAFDTPDEEVRELMRESFDVALANNIAVGFHIDDSMFWGRLSDLNTVENIEWLDWNKTPNTGRRLDWSATPTKIMPQLCVNSPAVVAAVKARATLIGEEVTRGVALLKAAGKEDLFMGIGAGWETMIGNDFDTGKHVGYCALTNKGYSATHPPADVDQAIVDVTKEFIDLWTASLAEAGVPDTKIYSHIALMPQIADKANVGSYLQSIHFTPPSIAYGAHRYAGFSTYPGSARPQQIEAECAAHGNQPWASLEGTALDPGQAGAGATGDSMEMYLGNLFNHGAVIVNVFGWGVGEKSNPFRQTAEKESSIAAYRKFLSGEVLAEGAVSSGGLPDKIGKIQTNIPSWVKEHPAQQEALTKEMQTLERYIKTGDITGANKVADSILQMMGI
jgi:hypothetical protein